MKKMRAIVQERYGSPDDLVLRDDVEAPVAGDDEVLVRVKAASLHPDVWHVVTGRPFVLRIMGGEFLRPKNPIPGSDMAGVVEAVGKNVTRFRPGEPVFGETLVPLQWANGGAFAEVVAVREDLLAKKPENVTFEEAASVPCSGFILLLNVNGLDDWPPGRRVLINGAGGGVGTIALQLLKAKGAHVTAVDTGEKKLAMLRSLGADEVIDFARGDADFTRRGVRYDFILDVPGNRPFAEIRTALEPEGQYVSIGHGGFDPSRDRVFGLIPHLLALYLRSRWVKHLRALSGPTPTKSEAIAILQDRLADGTITPVIDSTFPLSDVRAAFRRMMGGEAVGKVILTPSTTASR